MYDDLARTQRPSLLEWLVVNALIPSVLVSSARIPSGDTVKAVSSAVSITAHVAVGIAALVGTTRTGQSDPIRPLEKTIFFQPVAPIDHHRLTIPGPIILPAPDTRSVAVPLTLTTAGIVPKTGAPATWLPSAGGEGVTSDEGNAWSVLPEAQPEVLTGPLPAYPELLRQTGLQGRVVLEAVVDTTGRIVPQSILLVSATNPGFVAPARQALAATLFRPAMTGGKPVRMRVRIPYDFTSRTGMGPAR
jgi:TonB family protein